MSNTSERPYCTCNKNKTPRNAYNNRLFETEVDKNGYCIYCGYVGIWQNFKYERYPRADAIGGYRPVSESLGSWYEGKVKSSIFHAYYNYFHVVDRKAKENS